MGRPRVARLAVLVGLAAAFALGAAALARSEFASSASAGPLQVSTATLPSPPGPSAHVWLCLPNVAVTVVVSWDDDDDDRGDVEVLRATSPDGPWAPILDQAPFAGHYFDTTRYFSTTLYYAVRTTEGSWESPLSGVTSVDLPSWRCFDRH
jgi:hypothetical protein